jgi:hypothetical protein
VLVVNSSLEEYKGCHSNTGEFMNYGFWLSRALLEN